MFPDIRDINGLTGQRHVGGHIRSIHFQWRYEDRGFIISPHSNTQSIILKNFIMQFIFFDDIQGAAVSISEISSFLHDHFEQEFEVSFGR